MIEGKIADEDFNGDPEYNVLGQTGIRGRATKKKAEAEDENGEEQVRALPFHLFVRSSADVPRMVMTLLPRSRQRSVAGRRLARRKSRSRLRLLRLRRPGRARPRSKPTTPKMLRPSKLPRQRDEPKRPRQSLKLTRKTPPKLRLPRRRDGPRRPSLSLRSMRSPPRSSPKREAVLRRSRPNPRLMKKLLRSRSRNPLPRRAAARRRLPLPTAMTIRLKLPRPLLQNEADPRRGKQA